MVWLYDYVVIIITRVIITTVYWTYHSVLECPSLRNSPAFS